MQMFICEFYDFFHNSQFLEHVLAADSLPSQPITVTQNCKLQK